MGYDALLVVAIWMIATMPLVIIGERPVTTGSAAYQLYLGLLAFGYFHISWSRIGQTAGMRAWRIFLVNNREGRFTATQSGVRLATAIVSLSAAGLGYFWALGRADRATWPDLTSRSRLVSTSMRKHSRKHAEQHGRQEQRDRR